MKVSNGCAQDKRMSLSARGLLVTLMSLPPEWEVYASQIEACYTEDGKRAVNSALNELMELGYIMRKEKVVRGRKAGYDYRVRDYEFTDEEFADFMNGKS